MNVIKAVENNLGGYITELEDERARLVVRIHELNQELVTAYTLAQIVPTPLQPTLTFSLAEERRA
jgi:hypothetical protein